MCILCVIQKWSRGVATMLPWLVIPLIGLWALSQLLPPAFRFEITSPRLACVFVLLFTLFWYEILMPQLSTWRVRRNERLRERKRFEAIELQKLKKTATRRCRNCLTPYKDQNPGGGKFMCSYCGHISKRPVLDLPVPPGFSNSALIKDLVGKSRKILNGKVRSDNGWMHCQDWLENGNWDSPSVVGKSTYRRKNGGSVFGDEHCLAEKSYSGILIYACKILTSFLLSIRWLWRKTFGVGSNREDISSDADHRMMLGKRSENMGSFQESRGEKARRKAEEKRQARIEKELLEEEERKQREEVARLVEERRRMRDEKLEAEKDRDKALLQVRDRDSKKEAEKRRQERRKEKDKGSSKSNSDVEELDKRSSKESEKKRDSEKKSEIDRRESYRYLTETGKGQSMDAGHGIRNISANNFSRVNAGNRYLDHMKGTLLSSSKAFSGSGFLGRSSNTATATGNKDNKPNSSVDHVHPFGNRRDMYPIEHVPVKHSLIGDDKNIDNPVIARQQTSTAPKKTWQQLFTGSSSSPQSTNTNVISRPVPKNQQEACIPKFSGQSSSMHLFDNPISFGLPSPFNISTFPDGSPTTSSGFSAAIEPFPRVGGEFCELIPEEPELFEDTCHIPDPVSLLGPVSESLDNFQLDQGTGFISEIGLERPSVLKFASVSSEINKPSPIESPLSREKHSCSNRFPSTPKAHHQDKQTGVVEGVNANEQGTWQMWNSSPLGQDGLGLVGGPVSWLLSPDCNRPNKDDFMQSPPQKTMASLFAKDDQVPSGAHPHRNVSIGNGNSNGNGTFSPVIGSGDHDPWSENAFFSQLSGSENHFVLKTPDGSNQTGMHYGSPSGPCTNHPFELSPANCWSKNEWPPEGAGDSGAKLSFMKPPPVGDQFPIPSSDVESLWSV